MSILKECKEITYAGKYNIDPDEYTEINVPSLALSTHLINLLMRNGIFSFDKLLTTPLETLINFKGFGKKCIDELDAYCHKLKNDQISVCENDKPQDNLKCLIENRQKIMVGDFSFLDNLDLSTEATLVIEKYKNAFELLGEELASECVLNTAKILNIIDMFSDYQNYMKRYLELQNELAKVPVFRHKLKATSFIKAYTIDNKKRDLLYRMCEAKDCTILDMVEKSDLRDNLAFLEIKRFLAWCSFDLKEEIDELFKDLYTKDTLSTVIKMRAERHTLEEIGKNLGVTRERVRQLEAKVKRKFNQYHGRIRIISKIAADRNGDSIITPTEIKEYCGENSDELIFLLQSSAGVNYTYDSQLDVFIMGDDSIKTRVNNYIENLPDIIKVSKLTSVLEYAETEMDIPSEILEKAIIDSYKCTGEVYHRCRLTLSTVYRNILEKYYPNGIKVYDEAEIGEFRKRIFIEYGEIELPEHNRALAARISDIGILCGRGIYRVKNKNFISKKLAEKIFNYINTSENTIFLLNTLFAVFEKELLSEGIDNRYFLQGILRDLYGDKFFFKRDYITKDYNVTSFYSKVVDFIKKSEFPVSKEDIQNAFPGITEIMINFSVDDPNVLNYFGEYLHSIRLSISESEKIYLRNEIEVLVSDGNVHHVRDVYEIISQEKPEILTRNAALYPFSAYSILEYLFREEFQFMRPYIAKNGTEMSRTAERLRDFIYAKDEISVSQIGEFARDSHFQIQSLLEYVNSCNDEYLLVNDDLLMRIDLTGVDEMIAEQVDNIIVNEISETEIISDLNIWQNLPSIKIPWTDWLIYSIITKWGKKTVAGTSSNQFRLSVPLVAPVGNFDADKFAGVEKSHSSNYFEADNLDNIDALLEDIIDDSFLQDFNF